MCFQVQETTFVYPGHNDNRVGTLSTEKIQIS